MQDYDRNGAGAVAVAAVPVPALALDPQEERPDAAIREGYLRRIAELRGYGAEEGIAINAASEGDFWAFIGTMPSARRAGLALTDEGNLRAVWDDDHDDDQHLALQFLGNGMVQFVIFRRRSGESKVARVAGRDTFDGIRRQIDAFDLHSLVRA